MAKPNKPVVENPTTTPPASQPTAAAPAEAKIPKMARKQVEVMLKAGVFTPEQVKKMEEKGLITSGEGGGRDVLEQFIEAGVPKEVVKKLEDALTAVNAVLWKDAKTYSGKLVAAKKKDGSAYQSQIEAALWCKHFDPNAKSEKKTDESTPEQK